MDTMGCQISWNWELIRHSLVVTTGSKLSTVQLIVAVEMEFQSILKRYHKLETPLINELLNAIVL